MSAWSPSLRVYLVVRSASQTCSTVAWLFTSPHNFLSGDLVVRPASQTYSAGT
jgi:hypothetical protein